MTDIVERLYRRGIASDDECRIDDGDIMRQAAEEIERLRALIENAAKAIEAGGLDSQLCCSGHECGCRGSTVGHLEAHDLRKALENKP